MQAGSVTAAAVCQDTEPNAPPIVGADDSEVLTVIGNCFFSMRLTRKTYSLYGSYRFILTSIEYLSIDLWYNDSK